MVSTVVDPLHGACMYLPLGHALMHGVHTLSVVELRHRLVYWATGHCAGPHGVHAVAPTPLLNVQSGHAAAAPTPPTQKKPGGHGAQRFSTVSHAYPWQHTHLGGADPEQHSPGSAARATAACEIHQTHSIAPSLGAILPRGTRSHK